MLVVDPMKRITIPEIRQHPWFQHKLPAYLALPPDMIEVQHCVVDEEIIEKVCTLPFGNVTPKAVKDAVLGTQQLGSRSNINLPQFPTTSKLNPYSTSTRHANDLRVAYELLLDAKRHKLRIADVVLALQDSSRTPPASSTPRILGLGTSPSVSTRLFPDSSNGGGSTNIPLASGSRPSLPPSTAEQQKDVQSRKRRWYLGIQSKKDPAHVMTEVFKAMQSLNCVWYNVNNYRVLCLWKYPVTQDSDQRRQLPQGNKGNSRNIDGQTDNIVFMDDQIDIHDNGDSKMVISTSAYDLESLDVASNRLSPSHDNDPNHHYLSSHGRFHSQYAKIKIAMSLYKVQQNIYLLDFQRVEVSQTIATVAQ